MISKSTMISKLVPLGLGIIAVLVCAWALPALATTEETQAQITEAQQAIESSSQDYENAIARAEELRSQIDSSEQRLAELSDIIPAQQEKSNEALRELYMMERDGSNWLELILSSQSLSDVLTCFDYLGHVTAHHTEALSCFVASKNEFEATKAELSQARQDAQNEAEQAQQALAAAQKARADAQSKAEQEALAEREAAARAVQQALESGQPVPSAAVASAQASASGATSGADGGSYVTVDPSGAVETVTPPSNDGANWGSDKASFVNSWAGRIDAYLAGSPLSGYGSVFAEAAWDYGVDPRWSPAISTIESSKGEACFLPHNAWGWGSSSWDSWEEAINDHVAGLARGYGYTISEAAAQKYCPPSWSEWYNNVSAEMSSI